MSVAQKLSNPFLRPSPFSKPSYDQVPSYTNSYEYQRSSSPLNSRSSNFPSTSLTIPVTSIPPAPRTNYVSNQTQMRPTRDYQFSNSNNEIENLLSKNPFLKTTLLDNNRRIGGGLDYTGMNHQLETSQVVNHHFVRSPDYERNDKYDKYEYGSSAIPMSHVNNFHNGGYNGGDNRSDTGSAYTYINKIYDIDDTNKKYGGNPEKLSNPFGRKNLLTEISQNVKDDYSDYGYGTLYTPNSQASGSMKFDWRQDYASVPNKKSANSEYESGAGSPSANDYGMYSHQHTYNYDYQKNIPIDYGINHNSNIDSQNNLNPSYSRETGSKHNNDNGIDEKSKYDRQMYHTSKEGQHASSYQNQKEYEPKRQNQNYSYKVNYKSRQKEQSQYHQSRQRYQEPEKKNYDSPMKFSRDDQSERDFQYREPVFGGSRAGKDYDQQHQLNNNRAISGDYGNMNSRSKKLEIGKPNVPRIVKFDADQSDEEHKIKPDGQNDRNPTNSRFYESKRDQAVCDDDSKHPSIIEIKGMLYHKIETA